MLAGRLSHTVREAVEEWLAGWDSNGAEWDFWVERNEAFRSAVARLLHAASDDVAVTTSVSQGVSALVSALPLDGPRNRIVISEYEFPTVGQIAHAQELRGAEVVHVRPEADGSIPPERFVEAIDERTALVCCTTLSYRSGHRHDVAAIGDAARAAGALVLADSYQACGAVELDVATLGADIVTGGTVKYLLGTAGLGFMWVRPRRTSRSSRRRPAGSPTRTSSRCRSRTTRRIAAPGASTRGRRPCRRSMQVLAGVSLVERAGVPVIEAHVRGLADRLLDGLDELGATVATPRDPARRGPLVCVRSTDVSALVEALAAERIVVSQREDKVRIALHLYNVEDDVDRLLEALSRHRAPARLTALACLTPSLLPRRPSRTATIPTRSRTSTSPPATEARGRASCCIHGGFWRTGWDRTLMTPLAIDLARRGLAAWNVDYRRVGQEGGGWPGTLEDVAAAVDRLTDVEEVDATRVVTCGHSAGGHLALWLAARHRLVSGVPGSEPARPTRSPRSRRRGSATSSAPGATGSEGVPRATSSGRSSASRSATPRRRPPRSPRSASPSSSSTARPTTSSRSRRVATTPHWSPTPSSWPLPDADHFDVIDVGHAAWAAVADRLPALMAS